MEGIFFRTRNWMGNCPMVEDKDNKIIIRLLDLRKIFGYSCPAQTNTIGLPTFNLNFRIHHFLIYPTLG